MRYPSPISHTYTLDRFRRLKNFSAEIKELVIWRDSRKDMMAKSSQKFGVIKSTLPYISGGPISFEDDWGFRGVPISEDSLVSGMGRSNDEDRDRGLSPSMRSDESVPGER